MDKLLNYGNLNDVEFEYLCKDIMSKKLGVDLRRFAAGRDGGIDLVDDVNSKNIVVQVKHYVKSSARVLINNLKKEVKKIEAMKPKPKEYYVCCSKELSSENINEIYALFSDYMVSDRNIITLIEIDEFLTADENTDILKKHYKLATNILINPNFVDCEVLSHDIRKILNILFKLKHMIKR